MVNPVFTKKSSLWKALKVLGSWYGVRHTQCLMLFMLFVFGHGTKVIMSVAIVAMTDPKNNANKNIPTYSWSNNNVILSSFLWGYLATQLLSAKLVDVFGPKKILLVSMIINLIFCVLIPYMASLGSWGVIACRSIQGLAQGAFYPSVHAVLGRWVPLQERSQLASFVLSGGSLGLVISLITTGWISGSSLGWPYAFYLFGLLSLCWCILYIFVGSSSPNDHAGISIEEKAYIETSLDQVGMTEVPPIPWKKMITSVPVWAIVVSQCGQNWGYWTLLTNIPTYMNAVLNFNLKQNGLLSSAPYLGLWIMAIVLGKISDTLINAKHISVGTARKIFNSIGTIIPGITLLILGITCSTNQNAVMLMIVLLFIAVTAEGGVLCGLMINHLDLSPMHAGSVMGITNGISHIFSIAGPLALQWIVTDETDTSQWATAFYIAGGFYILTSSFYIMFASGEVQTWNSSKQKNESYPDLDVAVRS